MSGPAPHNVMVTGDIGKALEIFDWLEEQGWKTTVYAPIIAAMAYLGGKRGYNMYGEREREWLADDRAKLVAGEWPTSRKLDGKDYFGFEDEALAVAFALRFDGVAPEGGD